jgi:hypothetical protein
MSWPKGRKRPKKVGASDIECEAMEAVEYAEMVEVPRAPNQPPTDWQKGALLNVRNYGDAYVITLYPEEWSTERPERALRFTNPGECQDFVSDWYARESHHPLAR